jgi:hypothetical protein
MNLFLKPTYGLWRAHVIRIRQSDTVPKPSPPPPLPLPLQLARCHSPPRCSQAGKPQIPAQEAERVAISIATNAHVNTTPLQVAKQRPATGGSWVVGFFFFGCLRLRRWHGLPPAPTLAAGGAAAPPRASPSTPRQQRRRAGGYRSLCLGVQRRSLPRCGWRHAEEGRAPRRRLGAPAPPPPWRRGGGGQGAALVGWSRHWSVVVNLHFHTRLDALLRGWSWYVCFLLVLLKKTLVKLWD